MDDKHEMCYTEETRGLHQSRTEKLDRCEKLLTDGAREKSCGAR